MKPVTGDQSFEIRCCTVLLQTYQFIDRWLNFRLRLVMFCGSNNSKSQGPPHDNTRQSVRL